MLFSRILASASPLSETSTTEIVLLATGGLLTIAALIFSATCWASFLSAFVGPNRRSLFRPR